MSEEDRVTTPAQRFRQGAEIPEEQRRAVNVQRIALIVAILAGLGCAVYIAVFFQTQAWQVLGATGLVAASGGLALVARSMARRDHLDRASYLMLGTVVVVLPLSALFWTGATLILASGTLVLSIALASLVLPRRRIIWAVIASILGAGLTFVIDQVVTWPRFDVTQLSLWRVFIPGITSVAVLIVLWQAVRAFRIGTIRTRLLISFVPMVLLLAISISAVSAVMGLQSGEQRAFDNLSVVSSFKETKINDSIEDLHADLDAALSVATRDIQYARILTSRDDEDISPEAYNDALVKLYPHFLTYIGPTYQFKEIFLLDANGEVVLSTDRQQEGTNHSQQAYFQEGLNGQYAALVPDPNFPTRITLVVAQPVIYFGAVYETLGVVAGRASSAALDEIIEDRTGLGQTGETYLVSTDYVALAGPHREERTQVHSYGIDRAIEDRVDGATKYENHRGDFVFGVYRWLPELHVALLTEQGQGEVFRAVYRTVGFSGGVAFIAVVLAIGASLLITRSITDPIARLVEVTDRISTGDLDMAKVEREDEIGALARAFNSMTAQLRELIGSLEQRVADHTRDLERRTVQLEAATQVARGAAAIRDVGQLLDATVRFISDRFRFYHAGIFLLDETGEYAVLRAASSEGGQRMLARGHKLRVGEMGIVGYVAGTGEPRIALDVGKDAAFFDNPDLPQTRSEIALPLKVREQVIGVLDVQSTEGAAFSDEDMAILQTLADQVALAIENARLLEESQRALLELETLYGRRVREAWQERTARQPAAYRYTMVGVEPVPPSLTLRMEASPLSDRPTVLQEEDGRRLVAPIRLRGQALGSIVLRQDPKEEPWSPEEVALVREVSAQIALALENARLLEETRLRAEREHLTSEVTDRMHRAVDIDALMQTAVREMAAALGASSAFVQLSTLPGPVEDEGGDGKVENPRHLDDNNK